MRTARDAGRNFVGAIGAALACVTSSHLRVESSAFPLDTPIEARFAAPSLLRLTEVRGGHLLLDVRRRFAIHRRPTNGTGPAFLVSTVMYEYRLLDRRERELLVYHWQPGPSFAGPDHPHLHVSASLRAATSAVDEREIDLDKLHLPTGHVTVASVIRSNVTEFGVEPLRPDWARILDEGEAGERAVSDQMA